MSFANSINTSAFNRNFAYHYDECDNTVAWDTRSSGTASACNGILGEAGHPGMIQLVTGTDTGGKASALYSYIGSNVPQWLPSTGSFYYETSVKIITLATGGDDYDYYVGPSDGWVFGSPGNGVYFRYDRATSLNWLGVSANGGAFTSTDTGIPVTTGWHRLTVKGNSSSVQFYVDDVLGATNTTNFPTNGLNINSHMVFKTAGTTSRTFYQDYFYWTQQVSR